MAESKKSAHLSSLRLCLLGATRVEACGRAIDLRRKPKQLVKLLALQPRQRLHREQIIEFLWAGGEPEAATNNLHKTVHAARRALEPELQTGSDSQFILTREGQIILTAPDELWIDAVEFEKLSAVALKSNGDEKTCQNALALYTGDLLPEDLYEDWAAERREYLKTTYRKLLQKLARIYESDEQFEQGAEIARKLVALDELDEDAHRGLMRLYALGGNSRQAVKQFEICRAVLRKELGVEPERATSELFEQITSGKLAPPENKAIISTAKSVEKTHETQIKTNLPHQLTSFVGRAREIGEIRNLLKTARLLTLTGAGGIGKTRLAFETAGGLLNEFRDGIRLIELAALNDSALVVRAACAALRLNEDATRPLVETLREFLRDKQILLIFDNCEQIVAACAALVADLLRHCLDLRVLATSREALDTPGEIVWSVSTLSLPSEIGAKTAPADLADYESVQLFVERARLVNPHFALAANNAETVANLCRQLDGIPLAIELAAARVRVLSVEGIAARLDNSLQILTSGGRTVAPRHQTLRAAIDWSFQLLSGQEQTAWRALAIFAGGFTLDAAEFVCAGLSGSDSVLDTLTNLIDKSIIMANAREAETRYSMLETIRQYGAEKLREAGAETQSRQRHFDYFLQLAERAETEFSKPAQREWFERVETELDNFRVALLWCINDEQNAALGLRACNALYRFWQAHGYLSEGRRWFGTALSLKGKAEKAVRAEAFYRFGDLANLQGDFAEARTAFEQSVALWREAGGDRVRLMGVVEQLAFVAVRLGEYARAGTLYGECLIFWRERDEQIGIGRVLNGFGVLARYEGDYDLSASRLEESLAIFRLLNHKYGLTALLHNLGEAKLYQNDFDRAEVLLAESLDLAREIADKRWESYALTTLGNLAVERGDYKNALANFKAALVICREIGDKPFVAFILEGFACAFAAREKEGDARRAFCLVGAASALRESLKMKRSPAEQAVLNRHLEKVKLILQTIEAEAAQNTGGAMTLDEAAEYALQSE